VASFRYEELFMQKQHLKDWWRRNWKWLVPTGCLTMLVVVAGGIALVLWGILSLMKSSDVYQEAIRRAQSNAAVVQALGSPVEDGIFFSGEMNVSGGSGTADMAVPLSGPAGSGTLYINANKSWGKVELLATRTEGGQGPGAA
jgi:hypothetical protein